MTSEHDSGFSSRLGGVFVRLLREPLVQFLVAAFVLFGVDHLIHGNTSRSSSDVVTVSQGRVQQIAESYRLLSGRLPSRAELQLLIDDFADEEIAYREAVALGLDADDTIVRRRMRQKLEFLAEDAKASEEPTDSELQAWLREHQARYRIPERIAFRHVVVSGDKHGPHASTEVLSILDELRSGTQPIELGDATMLPSAFPLTTQDGISLLLGQAFADAVFANVREGWFGPVASPLGQHAVLIVARESARDPQLPQVRDKVRSDWIEARRSQARLAFQASLRERYRVAVEWPEIYRAADERDRKRHERSVAAIPASAE